MRRGDEWADAELRAAVELYRHLLRLDAAGLRLTDRELAQFLQRGPLARRNEASIRYRLRNISAVLDAHGHAILAAYSPAPQVGAGVRARIERMLFTGVGAAEADSGYSPAATSSASDTLLVAEEALAHALALLAAEGARSAMIGHNRPPAPVEDDIEDEVRSALTVVRAVRRENLAGSTTGEATEERVHSLARFGVRAAVWAGERLTSATDAAISTGVRVAVIALLAALPPVAKVIDSLIKLSTG